MSYHAPVLVPEVIEYLRPERGGLYFDGTVGGGGHAEALLERGSEARVLGVDRDPEAIAEAGSRLSRFGSRVEIVESNFADAAEQLGESLAGALLDLGLSGRHIDEPARGFSFRPGTPLDMRMSGRTAGTTLTAADLLNDLREEELADLFRRYGEEPRARRLAAAVVARRVERPFAVADDLVSVLASVWRGEPRAKDKARIFQALRIAVNEELRALDRALPALRERLAPAGVMVVLSYHSLEDRRVKDAFREWSRGCVCPPELPVCRCRGKPLGELLTRRPIMAAEAETATNPRARSVRLRAWRKAES